MRTTIDLPDDILKKAKIAAVERGTTLRELVSRALSRELGLEKPPKSPRKKVQFPIFTSKSPGTMEVTREDLARLEDEEDVRRHGFAD
ncbi:MAG: hypothetical protein H6752_01395 [Candidatus Omnitrophica bacterium]|nr:hypothetical protein [Candidatus Omnitrophota bacterium]